MVCREEAEGYRETWLAIWLVQCSPCSGHIRSCGISWVKGKKAHLVYELVLFLRTESEVLKKSGLELSFSARASKLAYQLPDTTPNFGTVIVVQRSLLCG